MLLSLSQTEVDVMSKFRKSASSIPKSAQHNSKFLDEINMLVPVDVAALGIGAFFGMLFGITTHRKLHPRFF